MMRRTSFLLAMFTLFGVAACQSTQTRMESAAAVPAETQAAPSALARDEPEEAQVMAAVRPGSSVFFARGAAEVDAAARSMLQTHAERLRADNKLQVTLTGYTDDLGSRAYNLAIADKRVAAVYAVLREMGVPGRQMRRSGLGAETAGRDCQSPECRRLMRRVELVYRK